MTINLEIHGAIPESFIWIKELEAVGKITNGAKYADHWVGKNAPKGMRVKVGKPKRKK